MLLGVCLLLGQYVEGRFGETKAFFNAKGSLDSV